MAIRLFLTEEFNLDSKVFTYPLYAGFSWNDRDSLNAFETGSFGEQPAYFCLPLSGLFVLMAGRSALSFAVLALCASLLPDEFFFGFLSPISSILVCGFADSTFSV